VPRQLALGWVVAAGLLPWLCDSWTWPVRLLACALVCAAVGASSAPLRQPVLGPVRRIVRRGDGPWLLFTPRGVCVGTLEQALRIGPWGWWLQFAAGERRVWCWLSAAAPDRVGYRRLARALTARWT